MKVIETGLKDCYIIDPRVFPDGRGRFYQVFSEKDLKEKGVFNGHFIQGNESFSAEIGTFRGLHFQKGSMVQAKLVRVIQGAVLDVVVDLREDSPTYMQHTIVELSGDNLRQLYVPRGFAHGFLTLTPDVIFSYVVDNFYSKFHDGGVTLNDPALNIKLEELLRKEYSQYKLDLSKLVLSEKDSVLPNVADANLKFKVKPTRYLVTGCDGQLGHDVVRELNTRGEIEILALTRDDVDICNESDIKHVISTYKPDVVFHCAAYTNVDKAEEEQSIAYDTNALAVKNITSASSKVGAKLVYISTDYVMNGMGSDAFTEESTPEPINHYGYTKYQGELEAGKYNNSIIARVSWVFGVNGNNFVKNIMRLADGKNEIGVVDDQIGSPTYTVDLAKSLIDLVDCDAKGIYNITNDGLCSWAEFTEFIFQDAGIDTKVNKITTDAFNQKYPSKAPRPLNSRLSKDKLNELGIKMPEWRNAITRYLRELEYQKVIDERNKICLELKK